MTADQVAYLVFGSVLVLAVGLDLGLLSKRSANVGLKKALMQTVFWVSLALAFFVFLWFNEDSQVALEYVSAYLMEWSLSIDNIFVFILIFSFFRIRADHVPRALLIGILMAIVLRVIFISVGVVLVENFHWVLYIFGVILLITGIKVFTAKEDDEYDPASNVVYRLMRRVLPIVHSDAGGKFTVKKDGKRYFTGMFVVIVMLATTDIVFALDSIRAVFAISQNKLVIYTSNVFAVLGLRSLYFLLKNAVDRFAYLQQGIAVVLLFIGAKMLAELIHVKVPVYISLMVIVISLGTSIAYSVNMNRKNETS